MLPTIVYVAICLTPAPMYFFGFKTFIKNVDNVGFEALEKTEKAWKRLLFGFCISLFAVPISVIFFGCDIAWSISLAVLSPFLAWVFAHGYCAVKARSI